MSVFTVGTVGRDVPLEVLDAAGARAIRLRGRRGVDLAPADRYLGVGVDPAVRALLAVQLASGFDGLDAIVVGSDTDASQRLFYLLRELRRVAPEVPVPPVHLVDVLHLPRDASRRYTLRKVREFAAVVEDWCGTGIRTAALRDAAAERDAVRLAGRRLTGRRRDPSAGISGSTFLEALLVGDTATPAEHRVALDAVGGGPACTGVRVLLTGSGHDDVHVTRAIEGAGAVVVADDHPDGELAIGPLVAEVADRDRADDPLAAIAARWHENGPTPQRASIAARAAHTARLATAAGADLLLAYVRHGDDAPLWDAAAQGRASELPVAVIGDQPYGDVDAAALAAALAVPGEERAP